MLHQDNPALISDLASARNQLISLTFDEFGILPVLNDTGLLDHMCDKPTLDAFYDSLHIASEGGFPARYRKNDISIPSETSATTYSPTQDDSDEAETPLTQRSPARTTRNTDALYLTASDKFTLAVAELRSTFRNWLLGLFVRPWTASSKIIQTNQRAQEIIAYTEQVTKTRKTNAVAASISDAMDIDDTNPLNSKSLDDKIKQAVTAALKRQKRQSTTSTKGKNKKGGASDKSTPSTTNSKSTGSDSKKQKKKASKKPSKAAPKAAESAKDSTKGKKKHQASGKKQKKKKDA